MGDKIKQLLDITMVNELVRPLLTFIITTLYNLILAWGVVTNRMTFTEYIQATGTVNGIIVGFWFGEKKGGNKT